MTYLNDWPMDWPYEPAPKALTKVCCCCLPYERCCGAHKIPTTIVIVSEPAVGIEPTTCDLRGRCSTD